MGRPSLLTPQVQHVLTEALEKALPVTKACQLAQISEATYYGWQKRAAEPDAPVEFLELAAAIAQARARAQEKLVEQVIAAAADPKNWRAATWLLERRYPADWAETLNIRVNSEVAKELGTFLAACRAELDADTWEQVRGLAERVGGSGRASRRDPATVH